MAFAYIGSIGTVQNKTAQTSTGLTTSAAASANDLVVVLIAKDSNSVTGSNNEITGVSDSAGNTYTELAEYTNSPGGSSAGAGVTIGIYACKLTSALSSGGTITVSFNASTTAKAIAAHRFTMGASNTLSSREFLATGTSSNSLVSGTLTSREHLYLAVQGDEGAATGIISGTSPFAVLAGTNTSGGGSASNM